MTKARANNADHAIEALTVQRLGGLLPTLRPQRRVDASTLDHPVRQALHDLLTEGQNPSAPAHPEAFSYVFSAQVNGQPRSVSLAWAQVPEALKPLLPDPQA